MPISPSPSSFKDWKSRLHTVIFESHTRAGKIFDVVLLILILLSILVVLVDSMWEFHSRYGNVFYFIEWIFTILFTIEYILRIISVRSPKKYAVSYLGIIDLLSIIPTYLSLFLIGAQSLLVLRVLRLLRVFRIFKLNHYLSEMNFLSTAIKNSARKISIFMLCVVFLVLIFGSMMYLVESGTKGFSSIPASIYWAIVTITTVGYGDVAPVTALGKLIAGVIMLLGYGIIAVPTGIVTTEMAMAAREKKVNHEVCPNCGKEGHDGDAKYCKFCGAKL
jgi:voltage-gated potassium channel